MLDSDKFIPNTEAILSFNLDEEILRFSLTVDTTKSLIRWVSFVLFPSSL
jgi:hypothetical protein